MEMNPTKKIPFLVSLPVLCIVSFLAFQDHFGRKGHDAVANEFKWIESLSLGLADPILEERDWFRMYNMNTNQMERLILDDLSIYGYTGWKDFLEVWSIGPSAVYTVNGEEDKIKVNYLTGSDHFDKVAILVDISKMKLILYYGRTYGM